jgi:hypothetical protein
MPVILCPEDYGRWLAHVEPARPSTDLLRPAPATMEVWKLDPMVRDVRNTDSELCEPWADDPPPLLPIVILIKGVGRSLQNDPRPHLATGRITCKRMAVIERGH